MDRMGIAEPLQKRMTGHKGEGATVHQKSYAHNPPTQGLLQRAGADPNDREYFNPVHFIATPDEKIWLEKMTNSLIPDIVRQYKFICAEYAGAKTQVERTKRRLTTIQGMLGSVINDVHHFFQLAAAPLVDPDTFQIIGDDSVWALYHNEALSPLLNLPPFHTEAFSNLQVSTLAKMKDRATYAAALNTETKCAMERYVVKHVTRPLLEIQEQNRAVMIQLQQTIQLHAKITTTTTTNCNRTVTPEKGDWANFNEAAGCQLGTLADGSSPRKRRVPITQEQAMSIEYKRREATGESNSGPIEVFNDKFCFTLRDYWTMYVTRWKQLEEDTGGEWRKDFSVGANGAKKRGRSAWWTQRSCMFRLIEYYMEEGLSEEAALEKAELVFCTVPLRRGKNKRPIKEINQAFKKELAALEINLKGRPQKKKKPQSDGEAFAAAFSGNNISASQQLHYEQAKMEAETQKWEKERAEQAARQQQKQVNDQARWEHVNRHRNGAGPLPPNYGHLHPLPYRPVPNQPPIPLGKMGPAKLSGISSTTAALNSFISFLAGL